MRFTVGKKYQLRGMTITFVRRFQYRGNVYRFTYDNGAVRDVEPDEVSQVQAAE
jgi:hypothetical protein